MNSRPIWQLEVLGKPRLVGPGGQVVRLEGGTLAVLTYVALEGPTPRSRLAGLLWPDTLEGAARNNLVHLIRRLNRACGEVILRADDAVGLSEHLWVDAPALLAGEAPGTWTGGPLLDGVEFDDRPDLADWLLMWRERLDAVRAGRLAAAASQQEDAGDLAGALATATRLLDLNGVSEEAHRRVMRLHYLAGDRGAALAAFERCRSVLQREFGTEPLPETLALAREIERGVPPAPAAPVRPRIPLSVLRPPSLIGREAEWARMEDAWAAGQFIVLAGEGGLGKSRLARDFAASKGDVVELEGRPGDALVPYSTTTRSLRRLLARAPQLTLDPWMRTSLSRLLPELLDGTAGPPEDPDQHLHAAIHQVFQAGLTEVSAVVYDDLHLADPASIEAMFVLLSSAFPLGQPGRVPRLIATARPGELPAATAEVFAQLARAGMGVRLDLTPLGAAAVTQLLQDLEVSAVRALGPQLARFTGGNPLFVLETVKHLIENPRADGGLPVAARVSQLIEGRLARLSPAALGTARGAAVLQSDVRIELVAAVLGAPLLDTAAAWEELEAAQVMDGERFSHDLVQETVLAGLPHAVRRLLNRSAARVLEREGASAARVARHWLEGGDDEKAAPHLLAAAEQAQRQGRLREAAAFCEQAADLFERFGRADEAFEAIYAAMRLSVEVSYQAELQRLGERLSALARTATQHARAYEARMHRLYEQRDWPGLEALSGATLNRAEEVNDRPLQAVCHEALAAVTLFSGRLDEARHHLSRLGQLGAELDDLRLRALTHLGLGRVEGLGQRRAALAHFEQALALYADVAGDPTGRVAALVKLAVTWHELGLALPALDAARRAEEVLGTLDADSYYQLAGAHSTFLAEHALGNSSAALATVRRALALHGQHQEWWRSVLHLDLAQVYLTVGAVELARAEVRAVAERADLQPPDEPRRLLLEAQTLTRRGERADAVFAAALAHPITRLNPYEHARLLIARGPTLPARQALLDAQAALQLAQAAELGGVQVAALTRRAQAHLALGDLHQAVQDSASARQLCDTFTPELPLGEVMRTHAAALDALGDPQAAQAHEAAQAWLQHAAQQVPEEFRTGFLAAHGQAGVPGPPSPDAAPSGAPQEDAGAYRG